MIKCNSPLVGPSAKDLFTQNDVEIISKRISFFIYLDLIVNEMRIYVPTMQINYFCNIDIK